MGYEDDCLSFSALLMDLLGNWASLLGFGLFVIWWSSGWDCCRAVAAVVVVAVVLSDLVEPCGF